ncbi:MAG: type II secretion system F family protein [Candidatus Paceibacterota bacterium]
MKFKYKAINKEGEGQSGKIEAVNQEKAIELLQKYELLIISVEASSELFSLSGIMNKIRRRVGVKKIVMFSKELSILISSGVSLVEALRIQYEQEDSQFFREQITAVADMVEDGATFSEALSRFPETFSDFYVNIVKSGEVSGKMQEALLHLADYVEKSYLLGAKVKNAMLYPCVILAGFSLVGVGMMVFVVPQLVGIFEENKMDLPLPTKILIAVSNFMVDYFIVFVGLIIFFIFFVKRWIKTPSGKRKVDVILLSLPPFNDLFKKFYLARFADNLSMLIGSGVNIVSALKISGDVAGNEIYRRLIYSSMEDVKTGGSIAYAFENNKYVVPMVAKMLKIGEKTGKIDAVLKDVAEFYTKEVDIAVDGLTAVIEPILIFVLGGAVGLLVAAIIMPIYQMTEAF